MTLECRAGVLPLFCQIEQSCIKVKQRTVQRSQMRSSGMQSSSPWQSISQTYSTFMLGIPDGLHGPHGIVTCSTPMCSIQRTNTQISALPHIFLFAMDWHPGNNTLTPNLSFGHKLQTSGVIFVVYQSLWRCQSTATSFSWQRRLLKRDFKFG